GVVAALVEPWRGDTVAALAGRARRECAEGGFPLWFEAAVAASVSPNARAWLDALVPDVLKAGLAAVANRPAQIAIAEAADGYLGRGESADAAAAQVTLRRALATHYLSVALEAGDHDDVAAAVATLETYDSPDSRRALATFRSRPSRPLLRTETVTDQDGVARREVVEMVFSSGFGQPPGADERERQQAEAQAALVRHQARERETEQERRRQVYNDLINLGTADDVAAYAGHCLEDPAAAPALTRLADYLESSRSSALAAHLAVRLEKADRSRLEA